MCGAAGIETLLIEPKAERHDGLKIGSSEIRDAIAGGDVKEAALMLGRRWSVEGIVGEGQKLGRTLGFPTANLTLGDLIEPRRGVYAVEVLAEGRCHGGVANFGRRPTVGSAAALLEVHLFDFAGDLYDKTIDVAFVDFIRDERKFDGLVALKQQISADAGAARRIEAVYSYPFQNHATMETMNATVRWTPERCEVWTPTQNGESALATASEAAGLPLAKCEVYKIHLGGGFGRRGTHDWVRQAVLIAKEIPGTPVKLIWSREEDMLHGRYHPVTQCKLSAGIDKDGNLDALHMRISGQSIVASLIPQLIKDGRDPVMFQGLNAPGPESSIGYTVPHLLIDHAMRNPHVPPGFWRGVNLNQNTIYLECFIDEVAFALRQDPLALRRKLMAKHPKHLAVLNAAAQRAGWGTAAAPGVFRGLAQTMGFGSYVAACAELSVSAAGELKIHRIVAATDCGHAVNPQQIEAQVEGSFVYGLSAALYGECTVKGGRIEQENFNTYPVLHMDMMPKVETIVMPSGGFWGGVGEPTIAVAAPAVLNAIFAATGKRIRDLPLKHHSLKKA